MKNQNYILTAILFFLVGCSSGNPIATQSVDEIPATTGISSVNTLGAYEFTIDVDSMSAELTPHRNSMIGESWIVSGKSYFDTQPCKDCFKIGGIGYEDGSIILKFDIRHPFEPGDTEQNPTGRNRLDLDIFDLAMVVAPKPLNVEEYPLTDISIPINAIEAPDGFTNDLANVIGSNTALPYVLVVDDSITGSSTYNKFEMGASTDFETKFPVSPGQTLVFDLYLTFGYGFSAVLEDRLRPKYFNPEFNRKAAWKVEVEPPHGDDRPIFGNTWDDNDNSTEYNVTVMVYDWQIGANVNPDLEEPTDVYAASKVSSVSIEIPGMTDSPIVEPFDAFEPGGTGMPDAPLVYTIPIANENLLAAGNYTGLVAVYDERSPLDFSELRDYLIHTPDGGESLNEHEIPAYVTYQTFPVYILSDDECGPITGNILFPSCPVDGLASGDTLNFEVSASSAGGGNPIVKYEVDYDYDGLNFNASAHNAVGSFNNVGPFIVETPCYLNVPRQYTVAFRATDSCFPPNETIFATCIVTVEHCDPSGKLIKAFQFGGNGQTTPNSITATSDNHIVTAGHFSGSIQFGGASGITLESEGGFDAYIAKYNRSGDLSWAKQIKSPPNVTINEATILLDDSVIATGYFSDTATFGEGEPNETILTSAGGRDIFIARYNADGSLNWAISVGGPLNNYGMSLTTLWDNSFVVVGGYRDYAVFGNDEPNETLLESAGEVDMFVARYNPDGTLIWAKRAGGPSNIYVGSVTALSDGSTVVTGNFRDIVKFGQGESNETEFDSAGSSNAFVARYHSDGTLIWAKHVIGSSSLGEMGNHIITLSDDSTVVVGRMYEGDVVFGEGESNETIFTIDVSYDSFVARYNANGTLEWAKQVYGNNQNIAHGATVLSDDSVVITGYFQDTAVFGQSEPGETTLESTDELRDIYFARYNHDGTLLWATSAGDHDNDTGRAITAFSNNVLAATGHFNDTAIFGKGEPNETLLTAEGSSDAFIAIYEP